MSPAAIGGILSGVGSVAGALGLGGSKFKSWHGRENARNEWFNLAGRKLTADEGGYYNAVRIGAEKAGFNPLTALGAAPNLGSAAGTLEGPKLASIQMLTEGLKGISDEFTGVASQERAAKQLALDLAKVELDTAKAVQGATITPTPRHSAGGPRLGRRANQIAPTELVSGREVTTARRDERTGISIMGEDVTPAAGTSDAEDWEARYGDVVSSIAGIVTLGADVGRTARRRFDEWRARRNANPRPQINHSDTRRWLSN